MNSIRSKILAMAAALVAIMIVVSAVIVYENRGHFWWKTGSARVLLDGKEMAAPRVYVHLSGDILIMLGSEPYLVRPQYEDIQLTNEIDNRHLEIFGLMVLNQSPLQGVSLGSAKMDRHHPFFITAAKVEFIDLHGKHVEVFPNG